MSPEEYIAQRVDEQAAWYGRRSRQAQWSFRALRWIEIVGATLIPLIAGFAPATWSQPATAALGAVVALCAALVGFGRYYERWIEYRSMRESLKREKFLFLTRATPYRIDDAFAAFVERIEDVLAKESHAWAERMRAVDKTVPIPPGEERP